MGTDKKTLILVKVDAKNLNTYKKMKMDQNEGGKMRSDFGAVVDRFINGALRSIK